MCINFRFFIHFSAGSSRSCQVSKISDEVFDISSTHRPEPHRVNIRAPSCSCKSFTTTHFPCRHLFQLLDEDYIKWEDLPSDYINIPFFKIDKGKSQFDSVIIGLN